MKTRTIVVTAVAGALLTLSQGQVLAQPTITTQPVDQSVSLNATARFTVAAQSFGGPLRYQWWFKDAALDPALNPSAAKNTLLLSNATEALAGAYKAVVANDHGSTTSQVATLTVDPTFTKITTGPVVTDLGAWQKPKGLCKNKS